MKITTTLKLPTYSCELLFIVTDQIKSESEKVYKKLKLSIDDDYGDNEGILLSPDISKYFLLIDIKYLSHNTLAHEIYHAAYRITNDRGVKDEEAQAWLCGHITGVIYKFLDKKKLEIKHGR